MYETSKLLNEVHNGLKMGISATELLIKKTKDPIFKEVLIQQLNQYKKIDKTSLHKLYLYDVKPKNPSIVSKSMLWMGVNMATLFHRKNQDIADLLVEGNEMGIRSIRKILVEHQTSDDEDKKIAYQVITMQQNNILELNKYLN